MPAVSLPILTPGPSGPLRITPTDVSQFVRLEQCERFLRFRLAERAGQDFMHAYDVVPQRITPLLTLSGRSFEEEAEKDLRGRFHSLHFAQMAGLAHDRPANDSDVVLVASRSIFSMFNPDEEVFANSQLWKNLLSRTCTVKLWEGERDGRRVVVWGGPQGG